jgi:hypothetical protein
MTRLLSRIPRRRAEREPDATPAGDAAGAMAPGAASDAGAASPGAASAAGDTAAAPAPGAAAPSAPPAGTDEAAPARAGFRERGRLRRRLRFLRRVRELGFRDLGGLVFDQHRFNRPDESLVQAKLAALAAVDGELRAIERVLRDERPDTELREAGVSACRRCGGLIGSDARFCSSCGAPVSGAREVAAVVAEPPPAEPAPAEPPPAEPASADPPPPRPVAAPSPDAPTQVARPAGDDA